jgi:hypothetical protein
MRKERYGGRKHKDQNHLNSIPSTTSTIKEKEIDKKKIPWLDSKDFSSNQIDYYNQKDDTEFIDHNNNLYQFIHNFLKEKNEEIHIKANNYEDFFEGDNDDWLNYSDDSEIMNIEAFPFYFLSQISKKLSKINQELPKIEKETILSLQILLENPEAKKKLLLKIEDDLNQNNEIIINRINYQAEKKSDYGQLLKEITLLCIYLIQKQIILNNYKNDQTLEIRYTPEKQTDSIIQTRPIPKDQSNPDN